MAVFDQFRHAVEAAAHRGCRYQRPSDRSYFRHCLSSDVSVVETSLSPGGRNGG